MKFAIKKVTGIGEFAVKNEGGKEIFTVKEKAFLVLNTNTMEVRTDVRLAKLLQEKYESVMESRYFGRGGIEVVLGGQLEEDELYDLTRLSYNLTVDNN